MNKLDLIENLPCWQMSGMYMSCLIHACADQNPQYRKARKKKDKDLCLLAFVLALAAFVLGLLEDKPFVGASVGYFSFLFLLAGRALTVLLSPPIVVYSPRVLPVYVYDAHADCAKNVRSSGGHGTNNYILTEF
ncbi:calpain-type cysteine protease ADL1-like isoform X1 [Magnolia sinica]|uniref:calpain-type cysteine protease ADL1-like isoform X1 n=1 Tax=Magnolia sinica TaxID=86752 RepID=UPI002659CD90|nr:calpain-type cysteine protease ADL1-like isoform X1 [Magnolia sinica]